MHIEKCFNFEQQKLNHKNMRNGNDNDFHGESCTILLWKMIFLRINPDAKYVDIKLFI